MKAKARKRTKEADQTLDDTIKYMIEEGLLVETVGDDGTPDYQLSPKGHAYAAGEKAFNEMDEDREPEQ